MRRHVLIAAAATALFGFAGSVGAEDFAQVGDLDPVQRTRDAVTAQDSGAALEALTEMQRRGIGIFAGEGKAICKEIIQLPESITDWRFRAVARQAYFRVAMSRRLDDRSCACLFDDFDFNAFIKGSLGKPAADLVDGDRPALEIIRDQNRRETEAQFRDFELACQAK